MSWLSKFFRYHGSDLAHVANIGAAMLEVAPLQPATHVAVVAAVEALRNSAKNVSASVDMVSQASAVLDPQEARSALAQVVAPMVAELVAEAVARALAGHAATDANKTPPTLTTTETAAEAETVAGVPQLPLKLANEPASELAADAGGMVSVIDHDNNHPDAIKANAPGAGL